MFLSLAHHVELRLQRVFLSSSVHRLRVRGLPQRLFSAMIGLLYHVEDDIDTVAQDFFSKIQLPDHCLHSVLPEEKTSSLALRPRGHQFHLST